MVLVRTRTSFVVRLTCASDRGEPAVDETNHFTDRDVHLGLGQAASAFLASLAFHVACQTKLLKDVFNELERQVFALSQVRDRYDILALPLGNAQSDKGSEAYSPFLVRCMSNV